MKRIKLGDVFAFKTEKGIKIIQWAYSPPKYGDFIRVFDNLYNKIPKNIDDIVNGSHSYIIGTDPKRLYKKEIIQLIGNYNTPMDGKFPEYSVNYRYYGHDDGKWEVSRVFTNEYHTIVSSNDDILSLPDKFRTITLINCFIGPEWLEYYFVSDFDLHHMKMFSPGSEVIKQYNAKYEHYYK